jgi:hypothetical protein
MGSFVKVGRITFVYSDNLAKFSVLLAIGLQGAISAMSKVRYGHLLDEH